MNKKYHLFAADLMKLAFETLELAVQTDFYVEKDLESLMPFMLYHVARELFDLYRAIVPSSYLYEISTIPIIAAVLHNECVYF